MNELDWSETTVTSDADNFPVFVEFDQVGEYTIWVAPRSDFYAIDEMKLTFDN